MENYKSARIVHIALLTCTSLSAFMPAAAGPLLDAARTGNLDRVEQIVYTGAGISEQGTQGDMPLHWAAFQGSKIAVAHLIAGGADINARVYNGNTPLHQAAYRGHAEIVEILIRHGASVNAQTRSGITPLDWARRNQHKDVERTLIAHGARSNRITITKPVGQRQDNVLATSRGDLHKDSVMFASLQELPSVKFIENHRATVTDPLPSINHRLKTPTPTSGFRIQLVAMSTKADAHRMWGTYRTRNRELLDGLNLALEPAEVDGRPFYRVQAGPMTRAEAASTCNMLVQRNQDCLVVNAPAQRKRQQ